MQNNSHIAARGHSVQHTLHVSNLTWDSNYSYVMYARCYPEGTVYDPHTWILNTYEQSDNQMKNTNDGDIPGLPRLFQDPCS